MSKIREIKVGKKVIGIIIDADKFSSGAHPMTPDEWPLQLLTMKRPKGHVVPNHMHKRIKKVTTQPQEAMVVIKGAVRVVIADRKKKHVGTYKVKAGQCLFLADGAHEVTFTENTLAYEFKTGPYVSDKIKFAIKD